MVCIAYTGNKRMKFTVWYNLCNLFHTLGTIDLAGYAIVDSNYYLITFMTVKLNNCSLNFKTNLQATQHF